MAGQAGQKMTFLAQGTADGMAKQTKTRWNRRTFL